MTSANPARRAIRKLRKRQRSQRFATVFVMLLAVVLFILVNLVGLRHDVRKDMSHARLNELSGITTDLLERVEEPVKITLLMPVNHVHYSEVDNLLREYVAANALLQFDRVDPDWEKGRAADLLQRLNLSNEPQVVFESGERHAVVPMDAIISSDRRTTRAENENRMEATRRAGGPSLGTAGGDDSGDAADAGVARSPDQVIKHEIRSRSMNAVFMGEQAFSSAINKVISKEVAHVVFLQGHGEHSPDDFTELTGYSTIAERLVAENAHLTLRFAGEGSELSPETCKLLVVAGPRRPIAQSELDMIDRYLQRKGRLLALVDSDTNTGIGTLLRKWKIQLGKDIVVEPGLRDPNQVPIASYHRHEITKGMDDLTTVFYRPRSVRPLEHGTDFRIETLVSGSKRGWAETDPKTVERALDPERDIAGPVSIALALEHGRAEGTAVEPTRIVVVGDSKFAVNALNSAGSEQLVARSVNWLLNRDYQLAAPGKPIQLMRLDLSDEKRQQLMFLVAGGLPAIVGLIGAMVWVRRRA